MVFYFSKTMKKAFVVHGAWHHTNTLSTMIRIQHFRKITCFSSPFLIFVFCFLFYFRFHFFLLLCFALLLLLLLSLGGEEVIVILVSNVACVSELSIRDCSFGLF